MTTTNFEDAVDTLKTKEDIAKAYTLLKIRSEYIDSKLKSNFSVGDKVQFTNQNQVYVGSVKKINPRTISVDVTKINGSVLHFTAGWKVYPSSLTRIRS